MTATPTDLPIARQREVHDHLLARGWQLDGTTAPGDAGFVDDPAAGWSYPASFGGARANAVADATPSVLRCHFTFDDEGDVVFAVVPAGNVNGAGCPDHDTAERQYALTPRGSVDLPALSAALDDLESRARAHDVRALVECRFFGPCR